MQKYTNNVQTINGKAIANAQVTVNILNAGVATLYSDNSGTPLANPVITDPYGVFSFYAEDGRYTLSILAGGVTTTVTDILLEDPLDGSPAAFSDITVDSITVDGVDLSASNGSSAIGFLQAGTGAVARTAQSKLRDTVSVKDFGAVGNGVTDDTTAIQNAITAIGVGGSLFFPNGSYILTGTLTPLNSQTIVFESAGVTLTSTSASVALMFNLNSKSRVRLVGNGATLDGNKSVTPTSVMISMTASTNCYLGYFKISNAPTGGYGSIEIAGTADGNILDHIEGYNSEGSFIAVDGSATGEVPTNTEIISPYVYNSAMFGIRVGLATDVTITKPKCTLNGIEMIGVTQSGSRVKVMSPDISGCGDNGISFSGKDNVVIGGELSNNSKAGLWCWGSNNRIVGVKAVNNNLEDAGNNWAGFGASANYGGAGQNNQFIGCLADDTQAVPTQFNGVRFAGVSYNQWVTASPYSSGTYVYYGLNIYLIVGSGTSGATPPTHTTGEVSDGGVTWRYINTFVTDVSATGNISQVKILRSKSNNYFDYSITGNPNLLDSKKVIINSPASASVTGTTAETTLKSVSIAGNSLGINGIASVRIFGTFSGAAGNKTIKLILGSTNLVNQVYTAGTSWYIDAQISNVNSAAVQRFTGAINRATDGLLSTISANAAENTANTLTLAVSGTLANAADTISVIGFTVELVNRS
jgi:hypothetical protein